MVQPGDRKRAPLAPVSPPGGPSPERQVGRAAQGARDWWKTEVKRPSEIHPRSVRVKRFRDMKATAPAPRDQIL